MCREKMSYETFFLNNTKSDMNFKVLEFTELKKQKNLLLNTKIQ